MTLCTPYLYTKYACIFGLTGSIGGNAEKSYIQRTYRAVPYDVPQFLTTCSATEKVPAVNRGVHLVPSESAQLDMVVDLTKR